MLAVVIFYTLADINIQSHEAVNIELSLAWSQRVIGGVIAAASGIMVMVRVGQKESLAQLAPLVVSALIGVLIANANWGVAIALGLIVATVAGREWIGRQD